MKASEVLNRYANGERDFRRTNLRGQSFKGQDLSGADFSEADIRGTNFTESNLIGASFAQAKAGVQKHWLTLQLIASFLITTLSFLVAGVANGSTLLMLFDESVIKSSEIGNVGYLPGITIVLMLLTMLLTIASLGLTIHAAECIFIIITISVIFAVTIALSSPNIHVDATANVGAGIAVISVVIAVVIIFIFAFTIIFAVIGSVAVVVSGIGVGIGVLAAVFGVAMIVAIAIAIAVAGTDTIAGTSLFSGVSAAAITIFSCYVAWCALKGDPKFALVRSIGVVFAAMGGTSFQGANLTNANFTSTHLKGTNFNHTKQQTILEWVCWQGAKKLDYARVGDSILANAAVRELLVTRNGCDKFYVDANLRGANLNSINLEQANLTWADLSNATLHDANLKDANLREVLAIGADFTGASLTGACLEAWNIDHTTILKDIDCQYVFLLEQPNELGSRERRPHEPDQVFALGDFERLYTKMMNVVQVLLRKGMNRTAFAEAFQQLMNEHPDITYESIQAVERKGNDALVTLEVFETTDKAEISRSLREFYESKVRQLEAKVETLHQLRAADLKEVTLAQKAQFFNQLVGGNAMQENTDQSRNINVGSNLNATGSTFNLGEISGSVSNAVNQLPSEPDPTQPSIKELLVELQAVIEGDTALSIEDKADALEQVKVFAELGQNPQQSEKEGLGRKAVKILKGTIAALPDTAKLAEAVSKLLPLITKALGLPF